MGQSLSITIGRKPSKPFKSIDFVEWRDIPRFAVLTGPNGSGKTQLLQVLAHKLSGASAQVSHFGNISVEVEGDTIGPHEVAYLPDANRSVRVETSSISNMRSLKSDFVSRTLQPSHEVDASVMRARMMQTFGVLGNSEEETSKLPDDFHFMLDFTDVSSALSHVFVRYQFRFAERLLQRIPEKEILQELGGPPWEFVNEALDVAGFAYRVLPPANQLLKDYTVRLQQSGSGVELYPDDLSSGEKTIFRTLLWFYNSKHNKLFPKLFLMDEPDAHLHPSMTRQFLDVVSGVLVDRYAARVIMTTHSPSTVALSPDQSVFVMDREQPRIRRAASKSEAIGLLTSGLVTVSPGTRFVLVEDIDDVNFYETVRDVLTDQGPSKDPRHLRSAPSIIFMPASAGKGVAKIGGGKSAVVHWIDKFDAAPLSEMFRGIIDLDDGNVGTPRICVLKRHSIENYRLDPLLVFGLLLSEGLAPSINGVEVSSGEEHRLREVGEDTLQAIVEWLSESILPELGGVLASEQVDVPVSFTNGIKLTYPRWMLSRRGKDLLAIYQAKFGRNIVTPPNLDKMQRRIRMLPSELADILHQIQGS